MTVKPRRIGVLGGSFDPVHLGHLRLANELAKHLSLDQVWFLPAWRSPFKQEVEPASVKDRLAMLKLAIQGYSHYQILTLECDRKEPSYTVGTLRELKKAHPGDDFFLLLGADAAKDFHRWKNPEEIEILSTVVVGARPGTDGKLIDQCVDIQELDISSTEIRRCVQAGDRCESLLPKKVMEYIYEHGIYI